MYEPHYEDRSTDLTAADILLIWELLSEQKRLRKEIKALSHESIAEKFGISRSAVGTIGVRCRRMLRVGG